MYDIAIIGAGIVGASIGTELSRYALSVVLIEKEMDVANGITKGNTAILHSGYNTKPDTLKAQVCQIGNPLIEKACKELEVPYKRELNKKALEESANPKRIVTTTVKLKKSMEQLPVRTKSPIPKAKMKACINCLKSIQVDMPIEIGQVIVENILDTDVSVVASKTIKENIKNRASTRF